MADIKTGIFAKNVQKRLNRAQEKVSKGRQAVRQVARGSAGTDGGAGLLQTDSCRATGSGAACCGAGAGVGWRSPRSQRLLPGSIHSGSVGTARWWVHQSPADPRNPSHCFQFMLIHKLLSWTGDDRLQTIMQGVLQKLGKADETKDEQFEEYVQNFKRQEAEGTRLQRELRGYLAAIKGMQEASMKLTESLHEVYEPDWYGREDVKMVGEKCDVLWEDFHQKLVDGSLLTLDTYLGQFPDIKNRIAKRSRKLVDYDSARHHLEALQSSKRKDESRISKAEEEFQKAQKVFEEFNVDLQEELPSLWSRRVGFYVNTFKNVSSLEAKFHKEIAVLCHKLYEVMTKLGDQHADKAFSIQGAPRYLNMLLIIVQTRKGPPVPPLPKVTPTKELKQENIINFFEDNFVPEINVTTPSQNEVLEVKKEETLLDLDFDPFKPDVAPAGSATATHSPMSQPQDTSLFTMQADQNMAETEQPLSMEPQAEEPPVTAAAPVSGLDLGLEMEEPKEDVVIPPGTDADETVGTTVPTAGVPVEEAEAEKAALPAAEADSMEGTKIDAESTEVKSSESPPPAETEAAATQVETLHDFEAANSDELNLQRGDVVLVVPSDSEADQDAGWLVGVKESDWLQYRDLATYKGLFPENFTRRLE
ncbi:Amphiphysin [Cricetulus griseus]|uniref:Amphiphysin n=1 Tax=Cricetulus griseus TaxID=10029 RepID=G3GV67_CRIGR|nr:Amphiphysin [Cricetulus griseus]